MTPNEAFDKVQKALQSNVVCMGGRDYDSEYVFFIAAPGSDKNKRAFVGGSPWSVDKVTGRVCKIDLIELSGKIWKSHEID